jgi:hypothetical protein
LFKNHILISCIVYSPKKLRYFCAQMVVELCVCLCMCVYAHASVCFMGFGVVGACMCGCAHACLHISCGIQVTVHCDCSGV